MDQHVNNGLCRKLIPTIGTLVISETHAPACKKLKMALDNLEHDDFGLAVSQLVTRPTLRFLGKTSYSFCPANILMMVSVMSKVA